MLTVVFVALGTMVGQGKWAKSKAKSGWKWLLWTAPVGILVWSAKSTWHLFFPKKKKSASGSGGSTPP